MKVVKFLYKKMMDDLKDADMLADWAECCKEKEEAEMMKYFGTTATARLKDLKETHALFEQYVKTHSNGVTQETVHECLWDEQHKYLMEWYNSIEEKIKAL